LMQHIHLDVALIKAPRKMSGSRDPVKVATNKNSLVHPRPPCSSMLSSRDGTACRILLAAY
jgi:hypothetical protein